MVYELCFMACSIKKSDGARMQGISARKLITRLYRKVWEHVMKRALKQNSQTNLTPSFRKAVGPLPLLLGEACLLLRIGALYQCLRQSNVCVGSLRHPNWGADGGGVLGGARYWVIVCLGTSSTVPKLLLFQRSPRRRREIIKRGRGIMEMRKGDNGNEEEGKKIAS